MEIIETPIDGLVLLRPKVFGDERGYFMESFNQRNFQNHKLPSQFVQDNQSHSKYGTLRGLHFQLGDSAQTKLVRATQGKILDVAVDIRQGSKTYGQHFSTELSADNHMQLLVPKGFAHGFVVLSSEATVQYKCDNFYDPKNESGIRFDDPELNIDWGIPASKLILSEKDKALPQLKEHSRE